MRVARAEDATKKPGKRPPLPIRLPCPHCDGTGFVYGKKGKRPKAARAIE